MHTQSLIEDYLRRLDAAAERLSPERRSELVSEIHEHIEHALQASGTRDVTTVRNLLERLGEPEEISAAAVDAQPGVPPVPTDHRSGNVAAPRAGGLEIAALIALAVGGFVLPLIGVFVGVALVWFSAMWTRADKLVVTALPIAVIPLIVALAFGAHETGFQGSGLLPSPVEIGIGIALYIGPALGGVFATIYLAVQAKRRGQADRSGSFGTR